MKVGVLSDTHLHKPGPALERIVADHLADTDLVIHLGDMTTRSVYHWLMGSVRQLRAVAGNMDELALAEELPRSLSLELEGVRVGAMHGWGPKQGVGERVADAFGPGYDLILYGHTHRFDWSTADGVRLLNPGSISGGYGTGPSLAILTIGKDGSLDVRRIQPS